MNDLHKALGEISSIRMQVARSTEFRGYGPATLATTSVFAVIAAGVQAWRVPDAAHHLAGYLAVWVTTAVVASALAGVEVNRRSRRVHSGMSDEMIRMAVEQFLPSAAAGLLITIVVLRGVPGVAWMVPGLWQVIFSLGIFASCRFLPRRHGGGGRVVSADGAGPDFVW
jgi:multisubunit Na+/H+ antiporter MnhG subunit